MDERERESYLQAYGSCYINVAGIFCAVKVSFVSENQNFFCFNFIPPCGHDKTNITTPM
jgi:hypothetical protein